MSWSFGATQSGSYQSDKGYSHGRFAPSGVTIPTTVWPSVFGAACVSEGVLIGDIVWVEFPTPTAVTIGGTSHTIARLAFLARPVQPVRMIGVETLVVRSHGGGKVSLQDFHFRMPAPPVSFSQASDGSFSFDVSSKHSVLMASNGLDSWSAIEAYDVVKNADGSICHHARIQPSATASSGFFRATAKWKGWDGTIKGR